MGLVRLGGVDYAGYPFLLTGIATVTGLLLWLVVTRTRFGKVLISVITDREVRSEEHTSELQSQSNLVCRLLLEKKKYSATLDTDLSARINITHRDRDL